MVAKIDSLICDEYYRNKYYNGKHFKKEVQKNLSFLDRKKIKPLVLLQVAKMSFSNLVF